MKIKNKTYLILPVCFLIVVLLSYQYLIINITASMKKGIYFKSNMKNENIQKGDIIAFCLDQQYQQLGLSHHYLMQGKSCDGSTPLIKEVVAVPGDHITLLPNTIIVNGKQLQYKTLYQDSQEERLAVFPRGYYAINAFWVIGTNSKNSWDSRYFGYIYPNQIISKLVPIITWN